MMLYGDLNGLCFFFCKEFFKCVLAVIRERGISFIPIMSRGKKNHSFIPYWPANCMAPWWFQMFFNFHLYLEK